MIGAMIAGFVAIALMHYGYVRNPWLAGVCGIASAVLIMSVSGKIRRNDGPQS